MKTILLILALTLSLGSVYSQDKTKSKAKNASKGQGQKAKSLTPEEKADKITNRLKAELTLTDEQSPKVKELTLARVNAVAEAKTKAAGDKKAFQTERKKIHQNWEEQMKAVLSADQYQKYLAKKEEKKKQLKEKREKAKAGKVSKEAQDEIDELEEEAGE